ncbi:MAG: DUF72 domain-containing protein [Acidobacteriota bacterium]
MAGVRPSVPIRIGTAGWSYEDWKGIVYPLRPPSGFDPLGLMSSLFDTNEINSSFYRIPAVATTRSWARRVAHNPRFAFTAKLFRGFTHERTAGSPEEREFLAAMAPLADEGRLAAVLVQFPVSFRNSSDNLRSLDTLLARFDALPLAAEFRHASWDADDARETLAKHDALFVNIDQPWIGDNLRATDAFAPCRAYYRFHGRNAAKWFGPNTSNEERYNYLYTEEQVEKIAGRLRSAGESATRADREPRPGSVSGVTAILNNHFRGQAVANAIQLQHRITGELVVSPGSLRDTYPALSGITEAAPPATHQKPLF